VPAYGSAYRLEGTAEKARTEGRGEDVLGSAGLKYRRLALQLASRAREAAIVMREVRLNC
jgi:hypothetical protein